MQENENLNFIIDLGLISTNLGEILSQVESEYKAALGAQLDVSQDTPQGRLIATEADARIAVINNSVALLNQINPNFSTGLFLDAICELNGISRKAASYSLLQNVELAGQPLTLIRKGVKAKTASGDIFSSTRQVLLDSKGRGTVDFIADELGQITCKIGELDSIVDSILGWETVRNPTDAVTGQDEQTDLSLRTQRRDRLAGNAISSVEAIISSVYAVAGVRSVQFLENTSSAAIVFDGVALKPHSVWVCVYGGADVEIARALLRAKTAGAGWNGGVYVNVEERIKDIIVPYVVQFDRPKEIDIVVNVEIKPAAGVVDAESAIKNALVRYAEGQIEGEKGLSIGVNVSPFELSSAIALSQPSIFIRNISIARAGDAPASAELTIKINELAKIKEENITVMTAI